DRAGSRRSVPGRHDDAGTVDLCSGHARYLPIMHIMSTQMATAHAASFRLPVAIGDVIHVIERVNLRICLISAGFISVETSVG
ncbi:hypothetical protein, partial [Microbacterium sp.]|uniref:hypothetical protein n=1 Tax=Microbacterium sp. TaxID=51671 RepID=UPI003C208396